MVLLRRPVARSTMAAVLDADVDTARPGRRPDARLDRLPSRPSSPPDDRPRRWSRVAPRRAARPGSPWTTPSPVVPGLAAPPQQVATMLAAGVQVPIAAGAWLLAWLADHPTAPSTRVHAVWETLRLTPPTWITARITTERSTSAAARCPPDAWSWSARCSSAGSPTSCPGSPDGLPEFGPDAVGDAAQRPGAWLPFGAGPHACPGRTLGHGAARPPRRPGPAGTRLSLTRAGGDRPEPGHRTATVPFHRRAERRAPVSEHPAPAGRVTGRARVRRRRPRLAADDPRRGGISLDDAIERAAEHFLVRAAGRGRGRRR